MTGAPARSLQRPSDANSGKSRPNAQTIREPMNSVAFALVIVFGLRQSALLVGPFHWVIQVIHLLLGVLAVGIGQISVARYRKATAGVAANRASA